MSAFLTTPGTADVTRQAARPRTPPHSRQTTAPTHAKFLCFISSLQRQDALVKTWKEIISYTPEPCYCVESALHPLLFRSMRCRRRTLQEPSPCYDAQKALIDSVAHEVQDVRECSACVSPSPPPPKPPNAPKPPCATPIDFVLVLDESGSIKKPLPECSMEGPSGLKAFAKQLVNQYSLGVDATRLILLSDAFFLIFWCERVTSF